MKKSSSTSGHSRQFLAGICIGGLLLLVVGFYNAPKPSNPGSAEAPVALTPSPRTEQAQTQSRSPRDLAPAPSTATPAVIASRPNPPRPSLPPSGGVPHPAPAFAQSNVDHTRAAESGAVAAIPSQTAAGLPATPNPVEQPAPAPVQFENPLPGALDPISTGPAPSPRNSANDSPDLAWRLLAQLAVNDTNVAAVLVENASQKHIPDTAWPAIATTLVSEDLQDRIVVKIDPSGLAGMAGEEGHQRLDLIETLLAAAPESARESLRQAIVWLSQQLASNKT